MRKSILLFAVFLLTTLSAYAQQTSLSGTVTDSSGAVVANANVVAVNVDGGTNYKAVTDQSGKYQLPAINAATYTLSVDAPGFARAQKKLPVLVGQVLELNFNLAPTTALTDVVVTATREATELQQTPVAVTVDEAHDLAQ